MRFIEYILKSDALYLGERAKGNIFKPCIRTIPFSQISGALNAKFGSHVSQISGALNAKFGSHAAKAVGYLIKNPAFNRTNYLTYSPRDRGFGISKLPLQVEYLMDVLGKVFVVENDFTAGFPDKFEIVMGGLRSKGFGVCNMEKVQLLSGNEVAKGILNVRIPLEQKEYFSIRRVERPIYGYLFKPVPASFTGNYVPALFEGSEVVAPKFLLTNVGR